VNVIDFLSYLLAFVFALLAAFHTPSKVGWMGLALAFAVLPSLIAATSAL
jgi:hypothetical protein